MYVKSAVSIFDVLQLLNVYDVKLAEYIRQVGVVTSNLEHFGQQDQAMMPVT